MEWGYYLLEASAYLSALYAFYWLLLQGERFYVLNRFFLLASPILAFAIPFLSIQQAATSSVVEEGLVGVSVTLVQGTMAAGKAVVTTAHGIDWGWFISYMYVLGVVVVLFRLLRSLIVLLRLFYRGTKTREQGITMVWVKKRIGPFSFFRWLFMPQGTPPYEAVIIHERVHIRQWHSLDVLLFEIVRAFQWFNPFAHLLLRDAKLNHEYLADEQASLHEGAYRYAMLLIGSACRMDNRLLVNPIFNHTQLKKRISMLETKKSAGIARLKYLLAVPVVAGLLAISAFTVKKDYGFITIAMEHTTAEPGGQELLPDYRFKTSFSDSTHKPIKTDQRLILINGVEIDKYKIFGVSKASKIVEYNAVEARQKFGGKGKHGAVEIMGDAVEMITVPPPPPPPRHVDAPPAPPKDTIRPPDLPLLNRLNPGDDALLYKGVHGDTLYVGKGKYHLEYNPDGSVARIKVENIYLIDNLGKTHVPQSHLVLVEDGSVSRLLKNPITIVPRGKTKAYFGRYSGPNGELTGAGLPDKQKPRTQAVFLSKADTLYIGGDSYTLKTPNHNNIKHIDLTNMSMGK
ncbi:M56 family metallopeptidase [Parapedobacter sp.]